MSFEKQPLGISEALGIIQGILAETMVMGANDTEPQTFQNITNDVRNGKITPEEGVVRARSTKDSKNDYH